MAMVGGLKLAGRKENKIDTFRPWSTVFPDPERPGFFGGDHPANGRGLEVKIQYFHFSVLIAGQMSVGGVKPDGARRILADGSQPAFLAAAANGEILNPAVRFSATPAVSVPTQRFV